MEKGNFDVMHARSASVQVAEPTDLLWVPKAIFMQVKIAMSLI